jgi:hypothetical protein
MIRMDAEVDRGTSLQLAYEADVVKEYVRRSAFGVQRPIEC